MESTAEDPREAQTLVGADAALHVGPLEDPDRYELIGPGISGGEGTTWRARYRGNLSTPVPVAVKVMRRPPSAGTEWPSEADRRRWRDQTELLRHVRLAHLVRLHDVSAGHAPHRFGESAGGPVTAIVEMEWLEGQTLTRLAAGRPATPDTLQERLGWIDDLCLAASELHSMTRTAGNPAVHRDLSPGNCMVTEDRGVVLIDVGGMQLSADEPDLDGRHTPAYSAPEVLAHPTRPRSSSADRYAVGAIASFVLTGQEPERDERARRRTVDDWATGLGLQPDFVDHLLAPLADAPEERPADLIAWSRRLRSLVVQGRRRRARRRWTRVVSAVAVAALLVAIGGAGAAVLLPRPPLPRSDGAPTVAEFVNLGGQDDPVDPAWWDSQYPPFTSVTRRGEGDGVLPMPKGAQAGVITLAYSDASSFTLELLGESGNDVFKVQPIGARYSGDIAFGLDKWAADLSPTQVKIATDGTWRMTVRDLDTLTRWPGSGSGDRVYRYDGGPPADVEYWTRGAAGPDDSFMPNLGVEYYAFQKATRRYNEALQLRDGSPSSTSRGTMALPTLPSIVVISSTGAWRFGAAP